MRIALNEIASASKCFRYYSFLKESKQVSVYSYLDTCMSVINKCYARAMETNFRADWKTVIGWVDSEVFKTIDVCDEEQFKEAKKIAEKVLVFIRSWYYKVYFAENLEIFLNINLEQILGNNVITGTCPIIKLSRKPTIMILSNTDRTVQELSNDIKIRGLQWMLSENLGCDTIVVEYISIGTQGGILKKKSYAHKKDNERTKNCINQVASLINMKANWPSVTSMCNSCPFNKRCKI